MGRAGGAKEGGGEKEERGGGAKARRREGSLVDLQAPFPPQPHWLLGSPPMLPQEEKLRLVQVLCPVRAILLDRMSRIQQIKLRDTEL